MRGYKAFALVTSFQPYIRICEAEQDGRYVTSGQQAAVRSIGSQSSFSPHASTIVEFSAGKRLASSLTEVEHHPLK